MIAITQIFIDEHFRQRRSHQHCLFQIPCLLGFGKFSIHPLYSRRSVYSGRFLIRNYISVIAITKLLNLLSLKSTRSPSQLENWRLFWTQSPRHFLRSCLIFYVFFTDMKQLIVVTVMCVRLRRKAERITAMFVPLRVKIILFLN